MNSILHHSHCPVCGSSSIRAFLSVKDYTLSGNHYTVWQCDNCTLRFTQDAPGVELIGGYYKSENYISHSNSSRGLINRLYLLVRRKTLRQKRKLVCSITGKQHGSVLDVGSGTGSFVKEMLEHGWQVTGLEPDADARKIAKEHFNCELKNSDELFHLPSASFDAITLWHVLEHIHDLGRYVEQLKRLLKKNGRLIIAVPNYTSLDAREYREYWAGYDVPRHLFHFSPLSMAMLMEKMGMQILQHRPMWFDSFYVSLLSSKYKNGKVNWPGAVFTGLRSNLKAMNNKKECSSVIYVIGPLE
ncbi:MAG TPA: methyltransferase domain-containing protein [Chitinophagaceae bacterium]|nr:methyltransferase domain-containing protein [Chitinophagaceae bacterium]